MITIKHSKGCISVEGHAEYAPIGEDIVCAAVSTLTQAFVASVEELTNDNLKAEFGAGKALIQYEENLSRDAQLLRDSFLLGVRMVAEAYPENVQILTEL